MASSLFQNQENKQSNQMVNNSLNVVKQMIAGRDPQEVFYEECKRRNVDANSILNIVKMFK